MHYAIMSKKKNDFNMVACIYRSSVGCVNMLDLSNNYRHFRVFDYLDN